VSYKSVVVRHDTTQTDNDNDNGMSDAPEQAPASAPAPGEHIRVPVSSMARILGDTERVESAFVRFIAADTESTLAQSKLRASVADVRSAMGELADSLDEACRASVNQDGTPYEAIPIAPRLDVEAVALLLILALMLAFVANYIADLSSIAVAIAKIIFILCSCAFTYVLLGAIWTCICAFALIDAVWTFMYTFAFLGAVRTLTPSFNATEAETATVT
jgi:hypothetical protein